MMLLAGLKPGKDIKICLVGLRLGECFAKQAVSRSEEVTKTRFKGLSMLEPSVDARALTRDISLLVQAAKSADPLGIYSVLGVMGLGCKQIPRPPAVNLCSLSPSQVEGGLESPQSSLPVRAMRKGAARQARNQ